MKKNVLIILLNKSTFWNLSVLMLDWIKRHGFFSDGLWRMRDKNKWILMNKKWWSHHFRSLSLITIWIDCVFGIKFIKWLFAKCQRHLFTFLSLVRYWTFLSLMRYWILWLLIRMRKWKRRKIAFPLVQHKILLMLFVWILFLFCSFFNRSSVIFKKSLRIHKNWMIDGNVILAVELTVNCFHPRSTYVSMWLI